jgi:hypothetical protein
MFYTRAANQTAFSVALAERVGNDVANNCQSYGDGRGQVWEANAVLEPMEDKDEDPDKKPPQIIVNQLSLVLIDEQDKHNGKYGRAWGVG